MTDSDRHEAEALPPGTRFVDAFVIDVNGVPRGKRLPAADWLETGGKVAFSAGALVLDARGIVQGPLGIGTTDGDPDGWAEPVPGGVQPVPWANPSGSVAQCLASMRMDGRALWYDSRHILADVVSKCRADGLHPVVACELEFYLFELDANNRPAPPHAGTKGQSGHLCLQHLEANGQFLHALHDSLAAQGIAAGTLVSEYGPGQFEVNLKHGANPLLAADQAVLLRRAVHGVAASQGKRATFMAKPYSQHAGNGLHVHVSLVNGEGHNRFGAAGGQALLEHAVAGMQALLPPSMALLAPNFSAYRRLRPGAFVAGTTSWGENTRSAAFRIPPGGAGSRRIEHRVASADASPHLVMACVLAGLHFGIVNQLTPAEAQGTPRNIFAALDAFINSRSMRGYFPDKFPELYTALRHSETDDLLQTVSAQEFAWYL